MSKEKWSYYYEHEQRVVIMCGTRRVFFTYKGGVEDAIRIVKQLNAHDQLVDALKRYGHCKNDCNSRYPGDVRRQREGDMSCDCGYEAALKAVGEASHE